MIVPVFEECLRAVVEDAQTRVQRLNTELAESVARAGEPRLATGMLRSWKVM